MKRNNQQSVWEDFSDENVTNNIKHDYMKSIKSCSIGLLIGILCGGVILAPLLVLLMKNNQLKSTTVTSTTSTITTTTSTTTSTSTSTSTTTTTTTTSSSTTSTTTTSTTSSTTTSTTSTSTTSSTTTTTTTTSTASSTTTTSTSTASSTTTTSTSTTSSTTTSTTTTGVTNAEIYWGFDNNLQDLYNNFNGIGSNGPTFRSPSYTAVGACLQLTQSSAQSVTISSPFLTLSSKSFTFEVWLWADSLYNNNPYIDNYIIGQYEQSTLDRALHITIRNQRAYFGFFSDDTGSNQMLNAGQWYHIAFVYDYSTFSQMIYIDGYLDVSRSVSGPYLGVSGSLTIGTGIISAPNNYFDGCFDSISYYPRVRDATEILRDATLVAKLKFDGNNLLDNGPLKIDGTGTGYSYMSSGRVNQSLTLSSSSSYVQITGLTRLGLRGWSYTVAIWIYPTSLAGGTIMHLSSRTDGAQTNGWCLNIMGLTGAGQIAINSWNGGNVPLTGPSVPVSTWTHVVATYSVANGERLYVNGNQYGASSGVYTFSASGVPMTITLGNSLLGTGVCNSGSIQMGQFYGSLDEFHVYARELSALEVATLANP